MWLQKTSTSTSGRISGYFGAYAYKNLLCFLAEQYIYRGIPLTEKVWPSKNHNPSMPLGFIGNSQSRVASYSCIASMLRVCVTTCSNRRNVLRYTHGRAKQNIAISIALFARSRLQCLEDQDTKFRFGILCHECDWAVMSFTALVVTASKLNGKECIM